jgi:FeS assembly SUF system regulator
MRLSSLADYAVVMMSAAARHCGQAKVNATTLSAETGIPLPTAQKLVSRLSTAGLLESSRGTGGGVRLARPPATISLADIVEAVEGPIEMTACVDNDRHECALESCCQVRPHMHVVNGAVRGALAGLSLDQLSRAPAKAGAQNWTPAFAGEQVR